MSELETIESLLQEKTPEAALRLRDLADTASDKETRKAAKRALFRLSQSGIVTPESTAHKVVVPQSRMNTEAVRAFASAFDGAGNRMLLFVLPDPDGGSPTLAQILFQDDLGVKEFEAPRLARRDITNFLEELNGKMAEGLAIAEIDADYARWLLAGARAVNQELGRRTPSGFLGILPRIGEPENDYPQAPVHSQITDAELSGDAEFPKEAEAFFDLIWFNPWFFDAQSVVQWAIVTEDPTQYQTGGTFRKRKKEADAETILKDATDALMHSRIRTLYVRRLEESADVLHRRGETVPAKQALYFAKELAEEKPAHNSIFATSLTQRSIAATIELMKAGNKES